MLVTPEAITLYLQQVARFATVEVAGQTKVAGRDTYLLRMTPVAKDTALGYIQAAIDGKTMVPLQVEVYAKGGAAPVVKFGFTKSATAASTRRRSRSRRPPAPR